MADVIVEEALKAVNGLVAGVKNGASNQPPIPVTTERNAAPKGGRAIPVNGAGGLSVTAKTGSGYFGVGDEPAGSTLNPQAQLGLFARVRVESDWLRLTTFRPVDEKTGYLDMWDDRNFRMHPVATEGPRRNIPLHKPSTDHKTFSTRTLSGAFGIRLDALRTAQRAGQNVNQLVQAGIASGIGNVLADLGVNGDEDLPDDSSLNKQRSTVDGWFKKIRENGSNYTSLADGFSYHNGLWAGMLHQIEKPYRSDRGLAWGMTDGMAARWLTELFALGSNPANSHPSIVNQLGQGLLNAVGTQANPLGKPGIVVPQFPDTGFGQDEGYSGVAPTSVTDNGDGTLTIDVNSLAGSGEDRSAAGADGQRYVTIGCAETGVEETLAIDYAAPNNTVTTSSLLGQTVASATAANYYVKWADLQPLFLGLWRFLVLLVRNGVRIYTVFYPHDEVIEVVVHMDLDYLVADYDGMSLVDDIISPRFDVLPV